MKHKTSTGEEIELVDLSNSHLLNIIQFQRRKAKEGLIIRCGGGTSAEDFWYDEDHLFGQEALRRMNHSEYLSEANRRKLSIEAKDEDRL